MKDLRTAPFIKELCETASNMYRMGWDERNGGNISVLLDECEVKEWLCGAGVLRVIPSGFCARELAGRCFAVTGTGKYFKNVEKAPEVNLGIIRITADGAHTELLWGFADGGRFTSELPAHLMGHTARLAADSLHKVIVHTHPTYTIAMNTVCPAEESEFTKRLWQLNTECIVVFPDGLGLLPWMVCGTNDIGRATAEKFKEFRLVVWTNHGIYGAGRTMDEAFGLIETVEKTAQIYMLTLAAPIVNKISDMQLKELANRFGVTPRKGILREV